MTRPRALDGVRVLVVEDVPDIRDVFAVLLKAEGARVMATGSGREAAELVHQHDFDVLLSDLGLPDVPGDVLIRQIRAASRVPMRVVAITGFGEPYTTRARQAGADAVLIKPVEWSRVLAHLRDSGLAASA
jgi:CheY-like chemotaxis protein